jgi:putative thiamine transport system ATP-binding protein
VEKPDPKIMKPVLELKAVCVFKDRVSLFDPVSLTISPGEIATIMGPSGCGKTTLLSAITGCLPHGFSMTGDVCLNGCSLLNLAMEDRQIGMLFQDDLLFPHLSIEGNLAFAIPPGALRPAKRLLIARALETAGLKGFEKRDPATLSGGQKARVSLLRTLLSDPKAIFLDEPFSKLDPALKKQIRAFVFDQVVKRGIPALLVTHDVQDCPAGGTIITLDKKEE